MELYSPWTLLLLLLVPVVGWLLVRHRGRAPLSMSSLDGFADVPKGWRVRLRAALPVLRMLCVALLVIALARPREGSRQHRVLTRGVVMNLVVDRSGSMEEQMTYDGQAMTRMQAVKAVLERFLMGSDGLKGRHEDMLGLVSFALYADTNCPWVSSPETILQFLQQLRTVPRESEENSTSIGDGLALAAARLHQAEVDITERNRQARLLAGDSQEQAPSSGGDRFEIASKVIVLLTDGMNNSGDYDPLEAASLAKEWGIRVYTIGVGGKTLQRTALGSFWVDGLDEKRLQQIAEMTGGFYARATNGEELQAVFEKIDELERTEIEAMEYSTYEERFLPFAAAALAALVVELLLAQSVLRKLP